MEPRIQYATTKDGVSIAVWTLGEGMPLAKDVDTWRQIQTATPGDRGIKGE